MSRFLEVRAGDLVRWADTLDARARLSVLLRRLVHSTGTALRTVDFPGNDDSQRPGWDGWVETNVGTPWIPEGKSGWEFGTTKEIGQKANDDFKKEPRTAFRNRTANYRLRLYHAPPLAR